MVEIKNECKGNENNKNKDINQMLFRVLFNQKNMFFLWFSNLLC
jgi:hypothetical protein